MPHRTRRQKSPDPLSERLQRLAPTFGESRAASGHYHRPLRGGQEIRDQPHGSFRRKWRFEIRLVRGRKVAGTGHLDEVYRDVEDHGTALDFGAPECAGGVPGGGLGGAHALGDGSGGHRHRRLVDLEVGPERPGRRVGREQDDGRAVLGGLRQPGERVGEARPLMDARDADLAARPCVAVGHHHGGALVTG